MSELKLVELARILHDATLKVYNEGRGSSKEAMVVHLEIAKEVLIKLDKEDFLILKRKAVG